MRAARWAERTGRVLAPAGLLLQHVSPVCIIRHRPPALICCTLCVHCCIDFQAEFEVARRRASSASRSAKLMLDSSLSLLLLWLLAGWGSAKAAEPLELSEELGADEAG